MEETWAYSRCGCHMARTRLGATRLVGPVVGLARNRNDSIATVIMPSLGKCNPVRSDSDYR